MKMTCSISECDKGVVARQMCSKHYTRWYKYGDPYATRTRHKGVCSVAGCNSPHDQHGYCHMHAARLRRQGTVADPEQIDNLNRHRVDQTSGCWVWQGPPFQSNGYGQMSVVVHGTTVAHRAYFIEANGPLPGDAVLDHLCRNRLCVNPSHLDVVTGAENVRRGLSSYAIRTICKAGLHDISKPSAWYSAPGNPSARTCYECSKAKWHRADLRKRSLT